MFDLTTLNLTLTFSSRPFWIILIALLGIMLVLFIYFLKHMESSKKVGNRKTLYYPAEIVRIRRKENK